MTSLLTGFVLGHTLPGADHFHLAAPLAGLLAGVVHVLAGPDHLAAVAPLAARDHRHPGAAGLRWGIGHSAGVLLVGILLAALGEALPLNRIGIAGERLVGVTLLAVGLWTLRQALRLQVHTHVHSHDGDTHAHLHFHSPGHVHEPGTRASHRHGHAAFGIGTLHGLAGSSHFLGVLPALALPSRLHAAGYLLAFAIGTVAAMGGFAWTLGRIGRRLATGQERAYRSLLYTSSATACCMGVWWLAGA